jgi:two-component system osmolarity sensor histidine kinase EnvZ
VKFVPDSLFGRAAITIALTLFVFVIVAGSATFYLVFTPLAKRSAEDLAAEIVTAAQLLPQLPEEEQAHHVVQLLHDHDVVVVESEPEQRTEPKETIYLAYFRESLAKHSASAFNIAKTNAGSTIWVNMLEDNNDYYFGFDSRRLGISPPPALLIVIGCGALLSVLASVFEIRRITRPLNVLASAAREIGQGQTPARVPVGGPREIDDLARSFNQMATHLQNMAENRSVMLAGISHDLRTPLTRLNLATEMIETDSNRDLVQRIRRNLDAINDLIGEFLAFSRGIETSNPEQIQLWEVIEALLVDIKPEGADVRLNRCSAPATYRADRHALSRVLSNLLKNAVQYGGGEPVEVNLECSEAGGIVEIRDRGPGIPLEEAETVFQPFYRLENARNLRTTGSGLGLAIARQLALKHGWTIELLPRGGGGTIARVTLPRL